MSSYDACSMKVLLEGELTYEQLNRWIAVCDGSARDALNVALGRLRAAETEIEDLRGELSYIKDIMYEQQGSRTGVPRHSSYRAEIRRNGSVEITDYREGR